jgi:hypothetical protein
MVDMQLLNSALLALAILVGAAITLSITIVAVAGLTQRGQARHGGAGGTGRGDRTGGTSPGGGTGRALPGHPAPETDDARTLVLH